MKTDMKTDIKKDDIIHHYNENFDGTGKVLEVDQGTVICELLSDFRGTWTQTNFAFMPYLENENQHRIITRETDPEYFL
jgi:hypothetical protein